MKLNVIASYLTNVDTSESYWSEVRDYDLFNQEHVKMLHSQLDIFIKMVKSQGNRVDCDTFDFELRSYRRHEDLNLPF